LSRAEIWEEARVGRAAAIGRGDPGRLFEQLRREAARVTEGGRESGRKQKNGGKRARRKNGESGSRVEEERKSGRERQKEKWRKSCDWKDSVDNAAEREREGERKERWRDAREERGRNNGKWGWEGRGIKGQ
jgi:hypothetical protein